MDMTTALEWAAHRRNAVLITLRKDGRAQSSDIAYALDDGTFVISVTDSRAKTANMRRDQRVVLHITHPDWSEYRQAMVDEGRLIARLTPGSVVGQVH